MTQQREAFEAWAVSKGISIERDGFGGYESRWTEGALEGWQAALQSQAAWMPFPTPPEAELLPVDFEQKNYALIDDAVVLKVRIDELTDANCAAARPPRMFSYAGDGEGDSDGQSD